MDDTFKIFVQRLRDGDVEKIHESIQPDFMDVHESELSFQAPVAVDGEAFISGEEFVINLRVETEATLPCAICKQPVKVTISIPNFYYSDEVANVRSGVFNYCDLLREAILLEVPLTAECHEGKCPERESLLQYYAKNKDHENLPFKDLDLNS